MVLFMVRCDSRLQKQMETYGTVNAFEPRTEIIIVCYGRECVIERKRFGKPIETVTLE